ncbi:hypothetical protein CALVIDRAFT_281786 [Calocera viscosa TUFC12733]|uniref:Uncharacterized protein n=1 Tax=Calocera viscosa (strain TUFC12733) TaxID=1330018 RepID=A0A167R6D8_CALVF|nr:hypothetical protein CALVIDRAFT_281786 [Calocera viscosa TUFC12733]
MACASGGFSRGGSRGGSDPHRRPTHHTPPHRKCTCTLPSRRPQGTCTTFRATLTGKFIVCGVALIWVCDALGAFSDALATPGWTRRTALAASGLGALTTLLLLYLIAVLPRIRGTNPDWTQWRQSSDLAVIIPVTTLAIPLCWTSLSWSLSSGSLLGAVRGMASATGIMILGFGLMGLIPKR